MATVGHPLSDVCNFLNNFYTAKGAASLDSQGRSSPGPPRAPGLPTTGDVLEWYAATSGYDPRAEVTWGMAFSIFKLSAICQGIAARVAARQASSASARQHAHLMGPLAELAWRLAGEVKRGEGEAAKL